MNTIKRISSKKVALNGVEYRGVTIGDVPNEYTQWFNYKGLTYIIF
jgi:uncharacterized protein (DUF3820 family)